MWTNADKGEGLIVCTFVVGSTTRITTRILLIHDANMLCEVL